MFFSTYVLTKKGPLAKVWLAAHWDKRLTRHEVKVVDLSQTILHIVRPVVPIALRTSGELLVGVVRIYALKVKHLLKEATEATLFLRVTTLASKGGSRATTTFNGQQRTTSIDGVVVPQKGDVEAVTFDWDAAVATKHGAAQDVADALGKGRFDAIADLLGQHQRIEGPDGEREDGLLASAWYTVQPTSQSAEELHNTQQHYDEIAKMRADLMALGERASGSASTSRSKSSLASMEKGRGSTAVEGQAVSYAGVGDELDIGVPLPDELPIGFPSMDGNDVAAGLPADPFLLPDATTADDEALGRLSRAARKPRVVNVLDLNSTTLTREAFEKSMADRSDILCGEPRRGPYDAQEEADRFTLSGAAVTANAADVSTDAAPLSVVVGDALRAAFAAALRQTVEAVAAEAARTSQPHRRDPADGLLEAADDFTHGIAEDIGGGAAWTAEAAGPHLQRKRSRDDDAEEATTGLSLSVQHTLGRLRAELSSRAAGRKKARTELLPAAALVGASCSVQDICQGLRRRDAARTFVDVLALASKQYVSAQQRTEQGEIMVKLNESAVSLFAAA